MKKWILTSMFFLCTLIGFAQKGIIRGKVTDENNLPLPGAVITVTDLNTKTITDFDGNFIILGLKDTKYMVESSYLGFKSQSSNVVLKNNSAVVNFVLEADVNSLNEIVLKGSIGKGQAKGLNKQKNNMNITNVVASDQVGKFPDANIGDAIKRMPGIAVQNDQGEARNIIIRGLATQLNSVTLNGERIPSAEGDNRNVQMDLIPSDMVQAVEVNKVVTPDMEGDAIGGSVNLVTRAANARRITATAAYGQNPIRKDGLIHNFSVVLADRFFNNKFGAVLSASSQTNEFGSDNVEFEWDKNDDDKMVVTDQDIRRYDLTRLRQSLALNLDYKFNNENSIYFHGVLNNRKDWENRYRVEIKDIEENENRPGLYNAEIARETKGGTEKDARLEEQQIQKFALNGEHILFGTVKADWKASYSKASEARPNERYIAYVLDETQLKQNLNDTKSPLMVFSNYNYNDPSLFKLDEITEENQWTAEENYSFKADFEFPINETGFFANKIKTGYKYQQKNKLRDNDFFKYDAVEDLTNVPFKDKTLSDFGPGSKYKLGYFVPANYLGGLDLNNKSLFDKEADLEEFVPGNYKAQEDVNSVYAMLTQNFGENFTVLAGLRVENTELDYTGYRIDVETAEKVSDAQALNETKSYTNWLPNLQLKYNFTKNTILRAAYSKTIARPNYYDLVPYEFINSDDLEFEAGNPALEATEANNLDLMFEHYFSSVGIVSLGGFYKELDNFIFNYREDDYIDNAYTDSFEYSQPRNGDKAKVYGLEASVQSRLSFISEQLNNWSVYLNYTYTGSETSGIEGREEEDLALVGAVQNMFNSSLAYENKKLTLRASLNFADDYIDEYGDEAQEDRYYDKQLFLDVNGNYELISGLRLFAEVKNLTNQPLRYYQGSENFTMQNEFYGINWSVGVKYNF
ncbi:TonB-dependent receptor [Ochrovirga pacifica]|uniref:TonB-dependent receptor n=1 Tax=Ochrovirga pacifica TaxID=1042376 RepID=UPI0002558386|nr:TonB-dependent receptor [Ochrovirga pacifica]